MSEQTCLRIGLSIIAVTLLIMLSFFLNTYLASTSGYSSPFGIKIYKIPSASMLPTIMVGDHIIVNLNHYSNVHPKRGDLVVFAHPEDHSLDYIKRIVGLPGDTIEFKDKALYINGKLLEEPYAQYAEDILERDPTYRLGPIVLPEDKYFVLGDNRDKSSDSRHWGLVDKKLIRGKALFVYWSNSLYRIGSELK
jgi:signal peptidase I